LQGDRLFQEIQGADAGRLDRGIDRRVARHHDHRHGQQAVALPFLEQVTPSVSGIQISSSTRSGAPLARASRPAGRFRPAAPRGPRRQDFREQLADAHFIVNYEYVRHLPLPSCLTLTARFYARFF
jgi:hypothetical protein